MILPEKVSLGTAGRKGNGLFASERIEGGVVILKFRGLLLSIDEAGDKTLQVDKNFCLQSTERFEDSLNHSCEPNSYIDFANLNLLNLVTLRSIVRGEELTFNYNASEYDLVKQRCWFHCACGSPSCTHEIKGFKYLSESEQRKLKPFLAPYLKALIK